VGGCGAEGNPRWIREKGRVRGEEEGGSAGKEVAGNDVTEEGKGMMSPVMTSQEMVLHHRK